jgi:hypothetical protein
VHRKPDAPDFAFKNTHLFPQRGKRCSVSGFALLSPWERNRARSTFKRFFPYKSLRRAWVLILLGQSLRVFNAPNLSFPEIPIQFCQSRRYRYLRRLLKNGDFWDNKLRIEPFKVKPENASDFKSQTWIRNENNEESSKSKDFGRR